MPTPSIVVPSSAFRASKVAITPGRESMSVMSRSNPTTRGATGGPYRRPPPGAAARRHPRAWSHPADSLSAMSRTGVRHRTVYRCTECDAQAPKWLGRCTECGAWSSLVEDRPAAAVSDTGTSGVVMPLAEVDPTAFDGVRECALFVAEDLGLD